MGNDEVENCITEYTDSDGRKWCLACKSGYGIGGNCKDNKCQSCIKCGRNCNTCRKCICTECAIGRVNPYDPNNCIDKGDDSSDIPIDYSKFECSASMVKLNLIFILIILLLFKIKFH